MVEFIYLKKNMAMSISIQQMALYKKQRKMSKTINENTQVKLDLKTIFLIIGGAISLASMYFVMQSDIAEAKELPKPIVSEKEAEFKDKLIRSQIDLTQQQVENIQEDVKEIKEVVEKIEERVYELKD